MLAVLVYNLAHGLVMCSGVALHSGAHRQCLIWGPCPACGVPNIASIPNSDMACCILSVMPLTDSCDKRLFSIFALRCFATRPGVGSKT